MPIKRTQTGGRPGPGVAVATAPTIIILDLDPIAVGRGRAIRELVADPGEIRVVIRTVAEVADARSWVLRRGVAMVANAEAADEGDLQRFQRLTPREREIVALVCRGLSNAELARELGISEATVRHHLTSVFAKLEVRDRVGLVIAAFGRRTLRTG